MILRRKKLENSKYFDERFPHASNKQKEQNREGELLKLHNRTKKKEKKSGRLTFFLIQAYPTPGNGLNQSLRSSGFVKMWRKIYTAVGVWVVLYVQMIWRIHSYTQRTSSCGCRGRVVSRRTNTSRASFIHQCWQTSLASATSICIYNIIPHKG